MSLIAPEVKKRRVTLERISRDYIDRGYIKRQSFKRPLRIGGVSVILAYIYRHVICLSDYDPNNVQRRNWVA